MIERYIEIGRESFFFVPPRREVRGESKRKLKREGERKGRDIVREKETVNRERE